MKCLITGVTGSGKTTVAKKLQKMNLMVYDSDGVEGLTRWENSKGLPVKAPKRPPKEWFSNNFWNWNKDKLGTLLSAGGDVYICGIASNQDRFYALFDKVFVLVIDQVTMLHRLNTRTENSFGRYPEQQASIIEWHKDFEKSAIKMGAVAIDATRPQDKVVAEILSHMK
ncbi:hypothetical protein A3A68_01355 [Candidatus Saccharibacteria bacterium RIFCSPLOWO2_01_FULL_48_13]|nr:MAG: hypothetical protein A3F38_00775 [Candidatus Saccharibacteria bacterium RIFCSPHIGHO2_12_FULL_48_21]OGL37119.1 MAG: hypothetical protein A3A68_01355 [Candidatus Saccharibacteria bacterium RIFCSPLOWO2_01_FULL_48_13]